MWARRTALLAAGADEVVAQELEASFTIIERVTREARLPRPAARAAHAAITAPAGPCFRPASRWRAPSCPRTPGLPAGAWPTRTCGAARGATLVAFTRDSDTAVHPSPDDVLQAGDVLTPGRQRAQLAAARALIAAGPAGRRVNRPRLLRPPSR